MSIRYMYYICSKYLGIQMYTGGNVGLIVFHPNPKSTYIDTITNNFEPTLLVSHNKESINEKKQFKFFQRRLETTSAFSGMKMENVHGFSNIQSWRTDVTSFLLLRCVGSNKEGRTIEVRKCTQQQPHLCLRAPCLPHQSEFRVVLKTET